MVYKYLQGFLGKKSSSNYQIDSLDGLRGLAVILVLIAHSTHTGFTPGLDFRGFGSIGVYCFFVLSSFLLTLPFLNLSDEKFKNGRRWLNYAVRRILRIYPLYVVILVFFFAISFLGLTPKNAELYFGINDVFRHLMLIEAKGYLWTIQVETKFYLILPFLLIAAHILKKSIPLIFLMVVSLIIISIYLTDGTEPRSSILRQLPVFLCGFFGAVIYYKTANYIGLWDSYKRKIFSLIAIACFVCIFLLSPMGVTFLGLEIDIQKVLKTSYIYGALWTCFLLSILHANGIFQTLFEGVFIRVVGIVSFSIYILHAPLLALIHRISFLDGYFGLLALCVSVFLCSLFTYIYIEKPFLKIKIT